MKSLNALYQTYNKMPLQVKASAWFLLCSFLQKGISTIVTPIFTRLLTTDEFGLYNVFSSWLTIVTIFVSLHLYSGVYTQGLIKFSEERNVFSSSLQGLTTALVAVWTIVYLLFHNFWNNLLSLTTVQMLAMLLMIWSTSAFCFWAAEQRVLLKYKILVAVTLAVSIAKPLFGVIFVIYATDKVTARILAVLLAEVIGYVGLYCAQMVRGKKFYSGKFWKYALLFNLPLIPHYLSQTVLSNSDRIMIANMVGDSEAGIYSLAYSISLIMTLFNSALSQTMSPWIYQKIKDGKSKDICRIAYSALVIIAVVNVFLMALAPEVVAIFAPRPYYAAIWVIPPVAMSVYFMFAYDLFAKFQFYYEKTNFIMVASVFGAAVNVILNYIFIPICGYIVAGYTTLLCYVIYAIAHFLFMNRVCKLYMNGEKPYSVKVLVLLSGSFMLLGFYFLLTYNFVYLRYASLLIMLIITFAKRELIMATVREIISAKGQSAHKN